MQIIVAGHLCLDIIPTWEQGNLEVLRPGSIVQMEGVTFSTGGAVANTGIALKKLGFSPILMGRTGDDDLGRITRRILAEEGVSPDFIVVSPGEVSSYTVVLSPPDTDRIFLHYPGTNNSFSLDDIDFTAVEPGLFHFGYPPLMRQMYQGEGLGLVTLFQKAKQAGFITSLDLALPDPNSKQGQAPWALILKRVLPSVDFFLPSVEELLFMLNRPAFEAIQKGTMPLSTGVLADLGRTLLSWGSTVVGIKLGEEGFYLATGSKAGLVLGPAWANRQLLAPIFETQVEGTTGAGDAAIAGFLAGFSLGLSPIETVNLAVAVGACCVEVVSSTAGIPSREVIQGRISRGWKRKKPRILTENWAMVEQVFLGPEDSTVSGFLGRKG